MMVTLLRIMDRKDAVPVVRESLKDQHFYTRWQIMREFLALDAEAALPSLRDMARRDPHPEIREAAPYLPAVARGGGGDAAAPLEGVIPCDEALYGVFE